MPREGCKRIHSPVLSRALSVWLSSLCSLVIILILHMLCCVQSISHVRLSAAPWTCSLPGSSVHGDSLGKDWSGLPCPFPGDLPNPGIDPRSPALQADSLPAEPQGKIKSTGVGSLSLLQEIFLTQESNWGLLHCRQILYQLIHQGSPNLVKTALKSKPLNLNRLNNRRFFQSCFFLM